MKRIAVGGAFVNQVVITVTQNTHIEKRFKLSCFGKECGGEHCRQGLTMVVDGDDDLSTFAALVLPDAIRLFYSDENVPSRNGFVSVNFTTTVHFQ